MFPPHPIQTGPWPGKSGKGQAWKRVILYFSYRIAPGPMCSEMQQNSLLVALVDDPEPGLPWPLPPVSSSTRTLWDQKEPVLPAPQRDTIDDVQAFCLLLGKWLRVVILGVQL